MQVSIESSEGLIRTLKVTVPAADAKDAKQREIRKVGKNNRFAGFRPGHVPTNVILQQYGAQIASETINQLINNNLFKALVEVKLDDKLTNALPQIEEVGKLEDDADFEFKFSVEVNPEINLGDNLSAVKVEKEVSSVTDENVDKMVGILRQQQGKWIEVAQKEAQNDDRVDLNFEGFIDGKAMEHGKADNYPVIIGKKSMIPGFEEQVIGHKAGDEFEIKVTFPEDYHAKEIAGKEATFNVKVNKVSELQLPELNEEFFKLFGNYSDEAAFRADIRKNMENNLATALEQKNYSNVVSAVSKAFDSFEAPARLVESRLNEIKKNQKNNVNDENLDKVKEYVTGEVKTGLIIDAICAKFGFKFDNAKVDELIERFASQYDNSEEFKKNIKSNRNHIMQISNMSFTTQFADFVLGQADVSEKQVDFFDIVNNNR